MRHRIYPDNKSKQAAFRARRKALGLCIECGKESTTLYRCRGCYERVRNRRGTEGRYRKSNKSESEDIQILPRKSKTTIKLFNRTLEWQTVGRDLRTT